MNRIFAIRAKIAGKKSRPAGVPAILLLALATAILLAGDAAWAVATKVETLETAITNNNNFGFGDKNSGAPVTAVEITSPDFVLGGKVKEGKNFGTDISALSVILTQINDKMTDSDLLKLVADVTASASGLITSLNTDGMSQITSGANRKWRNHTSAASYSGWIGDFTTLASVNEKKVLFFRDTANGFSLRNLHFNGIKAEYDYENATAGGVTNGLIGSYYKNTGVIRMGDITENAYQQRE